MTPAIKRLAWATLGGSVATIYTVALSQSGQAIVDSILITNTNAAAKKVRLHLLPAGGTAAPGNAVLYDLSIPANDFRLIEGLSEVMVLRNGEFLQAMCETADVMNMMVNGREYQ